MCFSLYLNSENELPIVNWNKNNPTFYLYQITDGEEYPMLKERLKTGYFYHAGSHMGCSCGFIYLADYDNSDPEDLLSDRIKSVNSLIDYLQSNRSMGIKLFPTSWDDFDKKVISKPFKIPEKNLTAFDLEEDVILEII